MKGLLISACALLLSLQSCEKYTLTRVYRAQAMYNPGKSRDTLSGNAGPQAGDTAVFVSAVIVPEDYDWRRDSLYGAVPCEICFFRNGAPQFSFRTGSIASSSPDTHHILDGHLYTEYAPADGTVICRDGVELFRYPQREMLKGLLVRGKDVYTLGRSMDAGGFCYRRNGEVLLRQDEGEPFGDFSNPTYGRNGALYEYEGEICFCFKTSSACYKVVSGTMSQERTGVSAFRIRDMRLMDQDVCYAADYSTTVLIFSGLSTYTLPSGMGWQSVGLFLRDGMPWFMADSPSMTVCGPVDRTGQDNRDIRFPGSDNFLYMGRSRFYSARCDGGTLSLTDDAGKIMYIRDSTYFFGRNSVFCAGDEVFALINPRERRQTPSVWHGGKETEYGLNGYLTGVEVQVSPPS